MRTATTTQQAIPMLQFTLDGGVVLPVRNDSEDERTAILLDDFDSLITELDATLAERNSAAARYQDAERRVMVVQARLALVQAALASSTRPGVTS